MHEVCVVYTQPDYTSHALSRIKDWAAYLPNRITLIDSHVIPYPLNLSRPDVELEFLQSRLLRMALENSVDASIQVCLCRDALEGLDLVLPRNAIVVIGGRRRWWRTAEQRLAQSLAARQRTVYFFDPTDL